MRTRRLTRLSSVVRLSSEGIRTNRISEDQEVSQPVLSRYEVVLRRCEAVLSRCEDFLSRCEDVFKDWDFN